MVFNHLNFYIMLKYIVLTVSMIFSNILLGHQPDISSTMLVEKSENEWVLQVRAALTAYEYVIKYGYPDSTYTTPEGFQDLVSSYVKENIHIEGDGAMASLTNPIVKLGHETNVIFQVKGIPSSVEVLKMTNTSFKDINRNQSAFILVKGNYEKQQIILNNSNDHSAVVKLDEKRKKIVLVSEAEIQNESIFKYVALGIVALLSFGFLIYKRNKSKLA